MPPLHKRCQPPVRNNRSLVAGLSLFPNGVSLTTSSQSRSLLHPLLGGKRKDPNRGYELGPTVIAVLQKKITVRESSRGELILPFQTTWWGFRQQCPCICPVSLHNPGETKPPKHPRMKPTCVLIQDQASSPRSASWNILGCGGLFIFSEPNRQAQAN